MSPGTFLPAVSAKPFDEMTLDEMKRERAYWHRMVTDATCSPRFLIAARDCRDVCDALIARRRAFSSEPTGKERRS